MITGFQEIKNLGRLKHLRSADLGGFTFKRLSLIYAENGCGKSTLARAFRAIGGDPEDFARMTTYGQTEPPLVKLTVKDSGPITVKGRERYGPPLSVEIFDQTFIEKNVNRGSSIVTGHRESLHTFALGEASARANAAHEMAAKEESEAKELVERLETQACQIFGCNRSDLGGIRPDSEAASKIKNLDRRIQDAHNLQTISSRASYPPTPEFSISEESLKELLLTSLVTIADEARKQVESHLQSLGGPARGWVMQGQSLLKGEDCPFCGQDVAQSSLVSAYPGFFDSAYISHVEVLNRQRELYGNALPNDVKQKWTRWRGDVNVVNESWRDTKNISLDPSSTEAEEKMVDALKAIEELIELKISNPGSSVPLDRMEEVIRAWNEAIALRTIQAQRASKANGLIERRKAELQSENLTHLNQECTLARRSVLLEEPSNQTILTRLKEAREACRDAERNKKDANRVAKEQAGLTVTKYQDSVNEVLSSFQAPFRLRDVNDRNQGKRGGAQRNLDYGFSVARLGSVVPDEDVDLEHFGVALSEGDKRCLALAFFLAKLKVDPDLSQKIVVLDDPMCSLGWNRRCETRDQIYNLAQQAKQVFVLCHDPSFILDLMDRSGSEVRQITVAYQLTSGVHATVFGDFNDLHHRESHGHLCLRDVYNFAEDPANADLRNVHYALRVALESYLRSKMHPNFSDTGGIGQMLRTMRDESSNYPFLRRQINPTKTVNDEFEELSRDINFSHHDEQQMHQNIPTRGQMISLASRVLTLIRS